MRGVKLHAPSAAQAFHSATVTGCWPSAKPRMAPKIPPGYGPQTRAEFWREMWHGLAPMTFLMVVVLGSIFAGWATATESAGIGVLGSFVIAWINRRLTLAMVRDAIRSISP